MLEQILSSLDWRGALLSASSMAAFGSAMAAYLSRLIRDDLENRLQAEIEKKIAPLRESIQKNDAATLAVLRHILKDVLADYLHADSIDENDIDFINKLYTSYSQMGGNGIVKKMYESVLDRAYRK